MSHLRYLSYVLRHKWFVLVAGLKTGAPLWRLLIHDWSKFTSSEWGAYVAQFYGPKLVPSYGDSRHHGGLSPVEVDSLKAKRQEAFDRAWLHHQHANPHHWQHWVLREDSGALKTIEMPEPFVREMVADWAGAGRAITGRWEVAVWFGENHQKMQLHPRTKALVVKLLNAHFDQAVA